MLCRPEIQRHSINAQCSRILSSSPTSNTTPALSSAALICQPLLAKQLSHPLSSSKYFSGNFWDSWQSLWHIITLIIIPGRPLFIWSINNICSYDPSYQHQLNFLHVFNSRFVSVHIMKLYMKMQKNCSLGMYSI